MTADIRPTHPILARIGERIRVRRLSYNDVAVLMGGGWKDGAVGAWLRGTRNPTLGATGQLAAVVDLEIGIYPAGTDINGLVDRVAELEAEVARLSRYVARHAIEVDEPSVQGRGWTVIEGRAA
jgi:transcriptional regulator with XRE-family HTH domain